VSPAATRVRWATCDVPEMQTGENVVGNMKCRRGKMLKETQLTENFRCKEYMWVTQLSWHLNAPPRRLPKPLGAGIANVIGRAWQEWLCAGRVTIC